MQLTHCCVNDPSDLCTVNVSGQGLADAETTDFQTFCNVAVVDASDNLLPFGLFAFRLFISAFLQCLFIFVHLFFKICLYVYEVWCECIFATFVMTRAVSISCLKYISVSFPTLCQKFFCWLVLSFYFQKILSFNENFCCLKPLAASLC